jgi:hypothetical protein
MATAPTPIECARAIEGYFVVTVEATVTEVNPLGDHGYYTADAEIFYDETTEFHKEGEVEQRQFLIAVVGNRLYVNP